MIERGLHRTIWLCLWIATAVLATTGNICAQSPAADPAVAQADPAASTPAPTSTPVPTSAATPASSAAPAATSTPSAASTPAARPAVAPVTRVQEVLDIYGVEESYFKLMTDGDDITLGETEALLRLLYGIGRFQPIHLLKWREPAEKIVEKMADPAEHRGEIVGIAGRVVKIDRLEAIPEVRKLFGFSEYFRCELEPLAKSTPWKRAIIYSLNVPAAWREQPNPPPGEYRASATAFFLKTAGDGVPVLATRSMAWHPPGMLGDLKMDMNLLVGVPQNTRQLPRDPFYELLAAAGRANPEHLLRATRIEEGAIDFKISHVRDWVVLPWKLGLAADEPTPSAAQRVATLLPDPLPARLRQARLGRVDTTLQTPLVDGLNTLLARADLYDPVAFREVFFEQDIYFALFRGLRGDESQQYRAAVKRYYQQVNQARKHVPRSAALEALMQQSIAKLKGDDLKRFNRMILEAAFPNEVSPSRPYSVVPLFLTPESQVGRLVRIEGVARRAQRIQVTDPEIVGRLGIRYYYEVWIFTDDSQDYPIVCCLRELPEKMPVGSDICEYVRVPAFFFKTWAFDSQSTLAERARRARETMKAEAAANGKGAPAKTDGETGKGEELRGMQPPSPMLIGQKLIWVRDAMSPERQQDFSVIAIGFFGCTIFGVWFGLWQFRRGDLKFKMSGYAPKYEPEGGISLNDLALETAPEPNFLHLATVNVAAESERAASASHAVATKPEAGRPLASQADAATASATEAMPTEHHENGAAPKAESAMPDPPPAAAQTPVAETSSAAETSPAAETSSSEQPPVDRAQVSEEEQPAPSQPEPPLHPAP